MKVSNLVWKGSRYCTIFGIGFVFAFHEKGKQLAFPFDIYGPSSDKTKAVILQDVIAVLYNLRSK